MDLICEKEKALLLWFEEELFMDYTHPQPGEQKSDQRSRLQMTLYFANLASCVFLNQPLLVSQPIIGNHSPFFPKFHAWLKQESRNFDGDLKDCSQETMLLCLAVIQVCNNYSIRELESIYHSIDYDQYVKDKSKMTLEKLEKITKTHEEKQLFIQIGKSLQDIQMKYQTLANTCANFDESIDDSYNSDSE